jgi:hypothetical protein
MPFGDFVKMYNWAKSEGAARSGALHDNINDIRGRLGAKPIDYGNGGGSPPAPASGTATSGKVGKYTYTVK